MQKKELIIKENYPYNFGDNYKLVFLKSYTFYYNHKDYIDGVIVVCGNNCKIYCGKDSNITCGNYCIIYCGENSTIDCGRRCKIFFDRSCNKIVIRALYKTKIYLIDEDIKYLTYRVGKKDEKCNLIYTLYNKIVNTYYDEIWKEKNPKQWEKWYAFVYDELNSATLF